jgi:hypothetical protein
MGGGYLQRQDYLMIKNRNKSIFVFPNTITLLKNFNLLIYENHLYRQKLYRTY